MNSTEVASKLLQSSKENVLVASDMYKLAHYNWCLFMWHLAIEKAIKALIAKNDNEIPYIHDLYRLSVVAGLILDKTELDEITTYNLEARYEEYKHDFYKKATKEYTDRWVKLCDNVYQRVVDSIKE